MFAQASMFCKIVMILVIIGALNWGLVGIADFNLVDHFLGVGSIAARVVYAIVGLSGLALLAKIFMPCPMCKK